MMIRNRFAIAMCSVLAAATAAGAQVITIHVVQAAVEISRRSSGCAVDGGTETCVCPPITAELDGEDYSPDLDAPQYGLSCGGNPEWPDWDLFSVSWVELDCTAFALSQAVHRMGEGGGGYHYLVATVRGHTESASPPPGTPLVVTIDPYAETGLLIGGWLHNAFDRAEISFAAEGGGYTIRLGKLADFNGDGAVSPQDIFDYLGAFFGQGPRADTNTDGAVTPQDLFDFLAAWNAA